MIDNLTIDRGNVVEPRRLRLVVSDSWPDHSDTDTHYERSHHRRRRIPVWAYLLCAFAGGFFGALVYFAVGGV